MSNIYEIANKIKLNGGNIYLVGGAIRDNLLGIENHDEDYCVTGISFDEFKTLFPEAVIRGKDFLVFSIDNKEFAIAKEVLTNKIIDPEGGIKDLKNKIIRAVSNHFAEDPLRVYRVSRFASQFDFTVEENTMKMMKLLKNELSSLTVERVYYELRKALLTDKPSKFFDVLKKADVLDVHFYVV